jgi:hypothetical protein
VSAVARLGEWYRSTPRYCSITTGPRRFGGALLSRERLSHVDGRATHERLFQVDRISQALVKRHIPREIRIREEARLGASVLLAVNAPTSGNRTFTW